MPRRLVGRQPDPGKNRREKRGENRIQLLSSSLAIVTPLMQAGKVKVLAVRRLPTTLGAMARSVSVRMA